MKISRLYLIFSATICVLLFGAGYLPAQHIKPKTQQYSGDPQSEGARIVAKMKFKPLEFTPPKAEKVEMDNGMILYLMEDHNLPLFRINATIRVGSVYDTAEKMGLASLVGQTLRSGGTTSMPSDKLNRELEFIAASVETGVSRESGSASLSVMKKDIDKGLKIFADILMNPAFEEDKIKKRKNEVIESLRRENDTPRSIVFREYRKMIYGGDHPYGRKIEGELETVQGITRDDIIAFYKKYFRPDNIIMGISGDFKKDDIVKKLNEAFGKWAKSDEKPPEVAKVKKSFDKTVNYAYKQVNQSNIVMGHLGIERKNKDYFPVMLMNYVLGGGSLKARIPNVVRGERGLAYSVHSDFYTQKDLGFFYVTCQTKSESTIEAITLILDEIRKISSEHITDEELTRAKDTIINQFVFRFANSASIVGQMVSIEFDGLPYDYLDTYVENIRAITKKDILGVAKKYLHPDKTKILVVGDESKFDKPLKELGKVNTIELRKY